MSYADYTMDELSEALDAERKQLVAWGQIACAATSTRGRREATAEHDKAQATCLGILDEMRKR